MVIALYIANGSTPKLTVKKIGSNGLENRALLKKLSLNVSSDISKSISK